MKPQQATACPFLALVAWATAHRDEIKCPAGLYSDIAGPAGTCLGVGAPEHHRVKHSFSQRAGYRRRSPLASRRPANCWE